MKLSLRDLHAGLLALALSFTAGCVGAEAHDDSAYLLARAQVETDRANLRGAGLEMENWRLMQELRARDAWITQAVSTQADLSRALQDFHELSTEVVRLRAAVGADIPEERLVDLCKQRGDAGAKSGRKASEARTFE